MSRIAAVMLTGHDPARREMAAASLDCFLAQTDTKSVLRIFNQSARPLYLGDNRRIIETPITVAPGETLGELKTRAVSACTENYVVLWDDDDFPSPDFIAYFRRRALEDALYRLQHVLIWDVAAGTAAIKTCLQGFSGPLFFDRRKFSRFLPINKGENWSIRGAWSKAIALNNPAVLYVRTRHTGNTLLKSEVFAGNSNGGIGLSDTFRIEELKRKLNDA